LAIDPDYVSTLAEVGRYYLPRWHGEPGELEAWAERAAELTKERWGDAVYTLVVMEATDYHAVTVFKDFKFSWPRVRSGFADLRKRSPDSLLYAEFCIRLAGFNGDRPTAQLAFATLDRVRGGAGDPRSYIERMWRIWSQDDFLTGDQERVIDVAHNPILRVEWPIDGKRWVVLDNHGELMTFEAETGKLASRVDLGDYEYAKFSSVVPFGKLVVAANYDDTVTSYKIPGGERRVLGKQHQITAAALSTDGAEYATAGNDRKIKFWKLDREEDFPDEWDFAPNYPAALAYLPGGRMMVVGGAEGTIGIWDRDTKKQTGELEKRKTGIRFLAVSSDGEQLAVADWKELTLWRIKTKELVATFPVPSGGMNDLVFSRDGRFVAAATGRKRGGDGHVVVWSTADKKLLHTFRGHKDLVYSVCFSPDGSRVVSGSEDMTIRVWKVE
jgi:WD40 repeat protein